MTVGVVSVASLKSVKNLVIGNPSAKLGLAQDTPFIHSLVNALNNPGNDDAAHGSRDSVRVEAAHVIASISYGSQEALSSLLHANALQAFLYALSNLQPSDPLTVKSALVRALRALASAIAEVIGPSQMGLRTYSPDTRNEAQIALDFLFESDCLNIYLPLLADKSTAVSVSVAQIIGSTVRRESHRHDITEWLPLSERVKEVKGKRGWEKPDVVKLNSPARQGGWVVRHLCSLLTSKDNKVEEAALSALAALTMDNPYIAAALTKSIKDTSPPVTSILSLVKSRSIDVQLAACLCIAHTIRANGNNHSSCIDQSAARNVVHVINRILSSSSESVHNQTKACYVLYFLVKDEKELCQEVVDRGSLEKASTLINLISPNVQDTDFEWDDDEPESTSLLREALLTIIAALSLFDNDIRRLVADELRLIPVIHASLSHKHVGVRCAACQCVRALSRAVFVIRTNIMDSGLGLTLFQVFKKEDEDVRVTAAALAAVCNIVNEFSPLQPILLELGLMPRLLQLYNSGDSHLKLNVLWAIRNLLRKSTIETKQDVITYLGWGELINLLSDPDAGLQEQAYSILRNLAENDAGVDLIFQEINGEELLDFLSAGLGSSNEDINQQAASLMANIANGQKMYQDMIFAHPKLLSALHTCMADSRSDTRLPIMHCVCRLIAANPKRRQELSDAGITSTLRHMCDWGGGQGVSISPPGRYGAHIAGMDDDKDVLFLARRAMNLLENTGEESAHSNYSSML